MRSRNTWLASSSEPEGEASTSPRKFRNVVSTGLPISILTSELRRTHPMRIARSTCTCPLPSGSNNPLESVSHDRQVTARSGRPVRRIESYVLGKGLTLIFIGYVAALLSIAVWAAWQLVVLYAGAST
jgi:hypothetical protein